MVPTRSLSRKLTLIGHIARKHGLSIDSLLEAEMVLADGSRVRGERGLALPRLRYLAATGMVDRLAVKAPCRVLELSGKMRR